MPLQDGHESGHHDADLAAVKDWVAGCGLTKIDLRVPNYYMSLLANKAMCLT